MRRVLGFISFMFLASAAMAVTGTWSTLGPIMPNHQSWSSAGTKIIVDRGIIYVSNKIGVNSMPLSNPTAWTYLVNGSTNTFCDNTGVTKSSACVVDTGMNALGEVVIGNNDQAVQVWNGSTFSVLASFPAMGTWGNGGFKGGLRIATDPGTGDIYASGHGILYRSTDNGANFQFRSDSGPACPSSAGPSQLVYALATAPSRELFIAGESFDICHSLDGGLSWSPLAPLPASIVNGNKYAVAQAKDGEFLLSAAFDSNGDNYFQRYTSSGQWVKATNGLPIGFSIAVNAPTNLSYLPASGEDFAAVVYDASRSGGGKTSHCIKWDGTSWTDIGGLPGGPGGNAIINSGGTDGAHFYVADTNGQLYMWTPSVNLPFTVSAGANQSVSLAGGAALAPTVTPAGSYTYAWSWRGGPGAVTFANPSALTTTASFSQTGDYVLTLKVTDGNGVSDGSNLIVHVTAGGGGSQTPARPQNFRLY